MVLVELDQNAFVDIYHIVSVELWNHEDADYTEARHRCGTVEGSSRAGAAQVRYPDAGVWRRDAALTEV